MNSNMDIYMENNLYLSAPCFVMDEKKLYFSNRSCNALVIVDRETWDVESMVPFIGEKLETKELHFFCFRWRNRIYFLPQGKKKLHVYDMESGEQKAYEMEGDYEVSKDVGWYFHVWENKIYLLPGEGGMELWSIDFDGQLGKENWWEVHVDTTNWFLHGTIDEQRFFTLEGTTRELTITDLENRETKTYQLPDGYVNSIAYDGKDFWYITSNSTDIVRWNQEHGEIERYSFPRRGKDSIGGVPYAHIYAAGQNIFVVSGAQEELFLLDKEDYNLKQIFQLSEIPNIYKKREMTPILAQIGDKLIWTFRSASGAAAIDMTTMEGKMYQDVIHINEKVRDCFDRILFQKTPLIIEDRDDWNLERFLYHCENSV